jgi:hypothetical protein
MNFVVKIQQALVSDGVYCQVSTVSFLYALQFQTPEVNKLSIQCYVGCARVLLSLVMPPDLLSWARIDFFLASFNLVEDLPDATTFLTTVPPKCVAASFLALGAATFGNLQMSVPTSPHSSYRVEVAGLQCIGRLGKQGRF